MHLGPGIESLLGGRGDVGRARRDRGDTLDLLYSCRLLNLTPHPPEAAHGVNFWSLRVRRKQGG